MRDESNFYSCSNIAQFVMTTVHAVFQCAAKWGNVDTVDMMYAAVFMSQSSAILPFAYVVTETVVARNNEIYVLQC